MKKFKMAFKLKLLSRDDLTFKIFSWLIFTLKVAKEKESVTRIEKINNRQNTYFIKTVSYKHE